MGRADSEWWGLTSLRRTTRPKESKRIRFLQQLGSSSSFPPPARAPKQYFQEVSRLILGPTLLNIAAFHWAPSFGCRLRRPVRYVWANGDRAVLRTFIRSHFVEPPQPTKVPRDFSGQMFLTPRAERAAVHDHPFSIIAAFHCSPVVNTSACERTLSSVRFLSFDPCCHELRRRRTHA
jgi:hypothetical protein